MTLLLNEHRPSPSVALTKAQLDGLQRWFNAALVPTGDGRVVVTPSNIVGAVRIDGLDIVVHPKLPIARLLTIIAEAAYPYGWKGLDTAGLSTHSLPDAVAALFAQSCLRTFEQGVLHSYRREKQRSAFVRGRMHVAEYQRSPMPLPIPVTAGVFDTDNRENQVLRAALDRIRTSLLVSEDTRIAAQRAWRAVSDTTVLRDPLAEAKKIIWDRRNLYYRGAVSLAEMILTAGSGANLAGQTSTHDVPGFILNMPDVVEQWVRSRLRAHWDLDLSQMPDSWGGRLWLDQGRAFMLKPDLAVRAGGEWRFIGDVKYKDFTEGPRTADVYQLVSYLTATGMSAGTLVYAGTAGNDLTVKTSKGGMELKIVSVDLSQPDPGRELLEKVRRPSLV